MESVTGAIEFLVKGLADRFDVPAFYVSAYLAVALVSVVCGLAGSLVVGNRMAFFSDAMAHCAFAGISLGFLSYVLLGYSRTDTAYQWFVPLVMVVFGAVIGVAIVYVRDKTSLTSDTVIGVFFAG